MKNLYRSLLIGQSTIFLVCFSLLINIETWGQYINPICNDLVVVSLDNNCMRTIEPDDILEGGPYGPSSDYLVEIDKTPGAPSCNGPWLGNTVGFNDIGQTYCVRVTYIVNGNFCTGNMQVIDNLAPTITCGLGDQTRNTDPGECNYTAVNTEFDFSSTSDNCYTPTVTYTLTGATLGSGGPTLANVDFLLGQTTVKWKATDGAGSSSTCSFTVQVDDVELPTITCVSDQVRDTDPGQCTYTINGTEFDPSSYSDNCDVVTPYCNLSGATSWSSNAPLGGIVLNQGLTTFFWEVQDHNAIVVSCSFTVQVNDNEPPTITCPLDQTRTAALNCTYTVIGNEFNPTSASDNCTGASLDYLLTGATNGNGSNSLAGVVFDFGLTTVTWTITDGNNATDVCSFLVSVSTTAIEICNGIDDDCDGQVDEGVQLTFYADADGDGYGDINSTTLACTAPPGYVADNTDCDDTDPNVNPGEIENCANGIDDDCDGNIDETRHPDYDALIALYNATNGPGWFNRTGWASGALGVNCDVCTWNGVGCNSAGRVFVLSLGNNNLIGPLPTSIGDVTYLQTLDLATNQISGNIPAEIGNLTDLRSLGMYNNKFSGTIPPEIGYLADLQNLDLSLNQITGNIPAEIGNLTDLTVLGISFNQLSGNIPPEIGNLTSLKVLHLHVNQLTGNIPPEIGNLTNLKVLNLYVNQLTGNIPPEIGHLGGLSQLSLVFNQLSGCFPGSMSNLCGVPYVALWANPGLPGGGSGAAWQDFCQNGTGGDADGDGYCKGTVAGTDCNDNNPAIHPGAIEICNNGIDENCNNQIDEASSHPDFAALMDLYNSTGGPNWTNKTGWGIDCNVCGWAGVVCFGGRVAGLQLENNNLIGPLPSTIGNLTNLTVLRLHSNYVSTPIPPTIGNLTNLNELDLSGNPLAGPIPSVVWNLKNLYKLDLSYDQLSGSIPSTIGNLTKLRDLRLYSNQLSGPIPSVIGNLALYNLDLASNQLSGCLPGSMSNFCNFNLTNVDLTNNPGLPGGGSLAAWLAFCSPSHTGGDFDGDSYCNGLGLGDCNDNNNVIYPSAPEICDGLDNDCDGPVDENIPASFSATVTNSCTNSTGNQISISNVVGGTPPYQYKLNNGAFLPTPSYINLPAGTYQVTVKDALGCTRSQTVVINPLMTLSTSSTNVSCRSGSDGSVSVSVSGGTPGYVYLWRRGSSYVGNTPTVIGLIAGNYRVTVRDKNGTGCVVTSGIVTVSEPTQNLGLGFTAVQNVSCFGGNNGSITAVGSGGTPPYTYSWSNFGSGPTISNLTAGTYTCTVTDAKGCTRTRARTLSQPSALTLSIQSVVNQGGGIWKVTLSSGGGTSPRQYRSTPPGGVFGNSPIFYLASGNYLFEVKDSKGCIKSISYTLFTDPGDERESEGAPTMSMAKDLVPKIILFPNPSEGSGFVSVLLQNIQTERAEFLLNDALGREVFRQSLPIQTDEPVRLPIQHLPTGVYRVAVITEDGKVYVEKLVVGGR